MLGVVDRSSTYGEGRDGKAKKYKDQRIKKQSMGFI